MAKAKNTEYSASEIWKEYENSKDYLERYDYYKIAEDCWRFYQGDQWHGLQVPNGQDKPPILNIIKPIIKYKVGTVNSNGYTINYSPLGYYAEYENNNEVCNILNKFAAKEWERLKYETKLWKHSTRAAVSGDSYAYFIYNEKTGQIEDSFIDNVSIHFADEQQADIQKQKYIIIKERLLVSQIRKMARDSGVSEEDISLIMSDSDTSKQIGDKAKYEVSQTDEDGKTTLLTKLFKDENGYVHIIKSTEHCIVKPDMPILSANGKRGLKVYPIAHLIWTEEYGGCRGQGDVYRLIDNQVEINKTNARYSVILKQFAFPHIVFDRTAISESKDIANLTKVGSVIGLDGNRITKINELINYLQPPALPADSFNYSNNLMSTTRELSGASDSVTGQINPEKASGLAIQAVQDAAAMPLNEQQANLKQFVEDIARIWIDMWGAYFGSVSIAEEKTTEDGQNFMDKEEADFSKLNYVIKVDVSPANPYSKYAQEQTMLNFLTAGYISFEQYVGALEDDSSAPKAKLMQIVEENKAIQQQQMQMQQAAQEQALMQEQSDSALQQALNENAQLKDAIQKLMGGANGGK